MGQLDSPAGPSKMPSPPGRRLGAALRHLAAPPAPGAPAVAAGTAAGTGGGSHCSSIMCINRSDSSPRALDQHLASLERDGVTIVEDVYSPGQLAELRAALARACGEVDEALPSVAWSTMHYQVRIYSCII